MGVVFIAVLMMALAGVYALLRGYLAITDRLVLSGGRARLTGLLWLLPLAALLILWSLPGYEITTVSYWPLAALMVAVVGTAVIALRSHRA